MKGNKFAGFFLIIFGLLYLSMQVLEEMNIVLFNWWDLWPLFIISMGLLFEYSYFRSKRAPGLLVPGGILLTIGSLHLFESVTRWYFSAYTWPLYTFAVSVGFLQYWFVTKERWAIVMGTIMFALVAFQSFIVVSMLIGGIISANMLFSILLIVIGLIILFGSRRHS